MGKIYTNDNKIILQEMIEIYKPDSMDWMQYNITKKNILTLYHIRKICEGGLTTTYNVALLTKSAHRVLNKVESIDKELYEAWNELFRLINIAKQPPCSEYISEAAKLKVYTKSIIY